MAEPPDGDALWIEVVHRGHAGQEVIHLGRRLYSHGLSAGVPAEPEAAGVAGPAARADNLGDYRCSLVTEGGARVWSLGFNSLFAEWQTIAEAKTHTRELTEWLRLPRPRTPVQVRIERRTQRGDFAVQHEAPLDPGSLAAPEAYPDREVTTLQEARTDRPWVNLVFAAEGYAAGEQNTFLEACARAQALLFSIEPYRSHAQGFKVRAVYTPSADSGISNPSAGGPRRTPMGASFGAFGLDRYMVPFDEDGIRRTVEGVPCDALLILCNTEKYGGCGLFNRFAAVAAHHPDLRYLLLHEFGHSFGGLADEYYTATVPYDRNAPIAEPWEANVTTLKHGRPKWQALLDADVPVPTPWRKATFEAMAKGVPDRPDSQRRLAERQAQLLSTDPALGQVGVFEGAMYRAEHVFRPEIQCLMFNRYAQRYCRVCCEAIAARIAHLSRSGPT